MGLECKEHCFFGNRCGKNLERGTQICVENINKGVEDIKKQAKTGKVIVIPGIADQRVLVVAEETRHEIIGQIVGGEEIIMRQS